MLMYTSLNNVTFFDYEESFVDNSYDTTVMESAFLPSEVSDSNFTSWDAENSFTTSTDGPYNTFMPHLNDDESWGSHDTSLCSSTAMRKTLDISYEMGVSHWHQKSVDQWTPNDTVEWVLSVAGDNRLTCEDIHKFNDVDGRRLIDMNEERFKSLEPICGSALYRAMQSLKLEQGLNHYDPFMSGEDELLPCPVERQEFRNSVEHPVCPQDHTVECEQIQPKVKRSPGRPRIPGRRNKKQEKKTGRLWEFIRDLLLKPEYCPSLICWEDHDQGIFRFVHSEKVARLWGTIKANPKMTYEKLSRAMRYYYRSKVLLPVLGRRLVYKFGPTATGWRTPNPNFKNKDSLNCIL
ncbi:hypothetical protein L9F63_021712 [Diploptera punctata]|uniref:ETS domain-containing protein n=1 Tax=Diploptera punctata TaxID=6984 RepID=A0AAD7ZNT1_DIPPU|nr:hypothetical protein L9F63_021712 [Diploptera punctata]